MESNQKFFPVLDREHRLTEHFIGIANIESKDPAEVRKGYERVIRPRFADAQFFFDEDLKQGIESMREGLASVTYQQKLGSYADKSERVAALAEAIAADRSASIRRRRAAPRQLSKADLQSRMVGEFPELQGIMGRYYAGADRRVAATWPTRSTRPTCRVSPAMPSRPSRWRRCWPWPSASIRWPVVSRRG